MSIHSKLKKLLPLMIIEKYRIYNSFLLSASYFNSYKVRLSQGSPEPLIKIRNPEKADFFGTLFAEFSLSCRPLKKQL